MVKSIPILDDFRLTTGRVLALLALIALATVGLGYFIDPGAIGLPLFTGLGAVTLAQAATLSENDLQRGVIETFVTSPRSSTASP